MHRRRGRFGVLQLLSVVFAALVLSAHLAAQSPSLADPDRPDQGYGPLDRSAPAIPPEQIIQQFTAKESEFQQAWSNYTYQRDVTVQTIDANGQPDGEYREIVQIAFDDQGRKLEKVTYAPENTLTSISMTPADMSDIEHRLPFVLTTQNAGEYKLTYVGGQKVDEVETYVFDVAPKVIEKHKRYFQGRIWVDQKDLQIVITSGKNVPDDTRKGHEDLSPPFTTYRQQIDGKYWFPVYTRADAILHFSGGKGYLAQDVHVREICRYTDYEQFHSTIKLIFQGQDVTSKGAPPHQEDPAAESGSSTSPK